MDIKTDVRLEFLTEGLLTATRLNQTFLAVLVERLLAGGALTPGDVYEALEAEQDVIEGLRSDPTLAARTSAALAASSLEQLAGRLAERLLSMPAGRPLLGEWRLDPADPLFPHLAAND